MAPAAPDAGSLPVGQILILPDALRAAPGLGGEREADATARLLLAVADVNPLVGSNDVAVLRPLTRPLTLRCRFAIWVNESQVGATTPLGTLSAEALALAEGAAGYRGRPTCRHLH